MTSAGDAYPLAGGVRVFTRERENVGQATNGFADKDALAQGPRCNIVGSVGCGMINAYSQLAQRAYREC